jgi:predicted DNA-binding transcriptional regulator AlpA
MSDFGGKQKPMEQIALELGVSAKTLHRWSQARAGPTRIRVGQRLFYPRAGIFAWLAEKEAAAARRPRRPAHR